MFKVVILLVSLIWASLLLVTWGGGSELGATGADTPAATRTMR